jgi:hypothetical protein
MTHIRTCVVALVVTICINAAPAAHPKSDTRAAKGRKAKPTLVHRPEEGKPGRGRKVNKGPTDPPVIEVYKDSDAWFGEAREAATLAAMGKVQGIDHFVHQMSELADGISPNADVVLLTSNGVGDEATRIRQNAPAAQANLEAFVRTGGVLIVDMGDNDGGGGYLAPGSIGTPDLVFPSVPDDATLTPAAAGADRVLGSHDDHRLVRGPDAQSGTVDDLTNSNIDACCYVAHGNLEQGIALPPNARILMTADFDGIDRPILAEYCLGSGRVIVDTVTKEFTAHQPEGSGPSYFLQALLSYSLDPVEGVPCQISGLRDEVRQMLRAKVAAKLVARLLAAENHLQGSRTSAACGQLRAFSSQARAERKKGLAAPVSDSWVRKANAIRGAIGCKG